MNAVFIPHYFFLSAKMCANFSNKRIDELRREVINHLRVLGPESLKNYVIRNGLPKVTTQPGDTLRREKRLLVNELMKMMGENPEKFQKLLDLMRSPASKKKFLSRCDCAKHPYEHAHRRRKNKTPVDGSCACCGHYFSVPSETNPTYSSGSMFTAAELQPPQGNMFTAAELQPPQGSMFTAAELQPQQSYMPSAAELQPSQGSMFTDAGPPPQGNMFTDAELQPQQGSMFTAAELQPQQGSMFTAAELQPQQNYMPTAAGSQPQQGYMFAAARSQPQQGYMFAAARSQPQQGYMFAAARSQPQQSSMFTDAELQPLQSILENTLAAAESPPQPLAGMLNVGMQDLFGSI